MILVKRLRKNLIFSLVLATTLYSNQVSAISTFGAESITILTWLVGTVSGIGIAKIVKGNSFDENDFRSSLLISFTSSAIVAAIIRHILIKKTPYNIFKRKFDDKFKKLKKCKMLADGLESDMFTYNEEMVLKIAKAEYGSLDKALADLKESKEFLEKLNKWFDKADEDTPKSFFGLTEKERFLKKAKEQLKTALTVAKARYILLNNASQNERKQTNYIYPSHHFNY